MIQVSDVEISFGGQLVLDKISFNMIKGERLGLVGRNGSGKTTLLRLITGQIEPDAGRIVFPRNYRVGYVEQHLTFTQPTILDEVCLGLRPEDQDSPWLAEKILTGLGFSPKEFHRSPHEYSGGFQVRLHLAKTLVNKPNLLLLDEPTNYLDIVSIRWLIGFLRRWEDELIIITHDREIMNSITTHTMAIHRYKSKKVPGDTVKLYAQIIQEEEIYERTRVREDREREKTMQFINRFRAQASRASMVQSRIKALERQGQKQELSTIQELGFSFTEAPFNAHQLARIQNLSFGYQPDKLLINDLSLEINKGDRICVIGKNGKGKSTLLRLLQGELMPVSGAIHYHPSCSTGYFGQTNIARLNDKLTIEKELATVNPDLKYTAIRNTAGAMMFSGDLALKKIAVLSGGEKSRVTLGKLLLTPTNLLLLDEPTNHLDSESCDSLIAALDNFPQAIVIVTHNEMFLHHLATRLIVFKNNKAFVFDGTYQDFLDKIGWDEDGEIEEDDAPSAYVLEKQREKEKQLVRRPLQKKVTNLENRLIRVEELLAKNHAQLAEAALANEGKRITELQIETHAYEKELETLYADLAIVNEELQKLG